MGRGRERPDGKNNVEKKNVTSAAVASVRSIVPPQKNDRRQRWIMPWIMAKILSKRIPRGLTSYLHFS